MSDMNFQAAQAAITFYEETAKDNVAKLKNNPYSGRGIILGISEDGKFICQLYWIKSRSMNNQNRILKISDPFGSVRTDFFNHEKAGDPSLVIYDAMLEKTYPGPGAERLFAVSNGHQTSTLLKKDPMLQFRNQWSYEPDAPNFTPRIGGLSIISNNNLLKNRLAIIKKSNESERKMLRSWDLKDVSGFGHCIHTYAGNGDPLPAFEGEPYMVPLKGNIQEISDFYWDLLNPDYRVSLVVKKISINNPTDVEILIINQNED